MPMSIRSKSCVLRANTGMFRDAYLDKDGVNTTEFILGIRQVKFDASGGFVEAKTIRLTEPEVQKLFDYWCNRAKEPTDDTIKS